MMLAQRMTAGELEKFLAEEAPPQVTQLKEMEG